MNTLDDKNRKIAIAATAILHVAVLLILVFLVLSNYKGVAEIIRVIGTYSTKQIKTLFAGSFGRSFRAETPLIQLFHCSIKQIDSANKQTNHP